MTRRIRVRLTLATVLPALFVLVAVLAGSVPVAHAATITVNSTAGDVTAADGNCTLREAINNAESDSDTTGGDCPAGSGADTIELGTGLTYVLDTIDNFFPTANGLPLVTSEITINGNGSTVERSSVLATPQFRIFRVATTGILDLNDLTVRNGDAADTLGGGVRTDGTVTISNGTITQNIARTGGGIYNLGILTLNNSSTVSNNTAGRSGGGIRNNSGTISLTNSTVTGNTAGDVGGGINSSGTLTLNATTVTNNTAVSWGGGINNGGANVSVITDSLISNNTAGRSGGGINNGATLTITNVTVRGNTSGESGGGVNNGGNIFSSSGTMSLIDSTISDNTARFEGGGINSDGILTITNSPISGNTAGGRGGGVNQWSNGEATLTGFTISDNSASFDGGGIANDGTLTLVDIDVITNTTGFDGGGIYSGSSGVVDLANTTVGSNVADFLGGGIQNFGTLTITDTTIDSNTAGFHGGGIRDSGTLTMTDSTISGNTATLSGGGGFISGINTLNNITISGNTSVEVHGGGIDNHGTSTLTNVTLSENSSPNGGGIRNSVGTISLTNTIIANSLSGGDCSGAITSLGNNLDSDNTCELTGPGDITGMDPLLGLLQDNGGPTFTHALQSGSPAIDTGDNIPCPATDQRGVPRPRDGDGDLLGVCDIGAYEFGFSLTGPTPGQAGITNTVEVTGAPPGREISFARGSGPGPSDVPGCGLIGDVGDTPVVLGAALADASGNASLSALAPGSLAGQTVRLQAVAQASCQVSNVVVHTFP